MRLGIIFRVLGIVVLGGVLALQGTALKTRAFEGRTEHYTVVLKTGAVPALVAAEHKSKGVKVETLANEGTPMYAGSMPSDVASKIRADERVAYIAMDGHTDIQHGWWETTMITLGLHSPHI